MKILKWYNSQDDKKVNLCEIDLDIELSEKQKLEILKKFLNIKESEIFELNEDDKIYISDFTIPKLSNFNFKFLNSDYKNFLKELLLTRESELQELKTKRSLEFASNGIRETYWQYKEPFWTIDVNSTATKNAFQIKQAFENAYKIDETEFIKKYQFWYGFNGINKSSSKPTLTYEQFLKFLPYDLEICLKIRQINNIKRKLGMLKNSKL